MIEDIKICGKNYLNPNRVPGFRVQVVLVNK